MAGELQAQTFQTTGTVYARLWNATGQYWYTVTPAFETFNAAHITSYALTGTQDGTTGKWTANMPAAAAGVYSYAFFLQSGGSPAQSDQAISTAGTIDWDGSAAITAPALRPTTAARTLNVSSGGVADADAKAINAVSTSPVTTIGANVGTTQPINFIGTGATAYVKSDLEQWIGVAPNALISGRVDANAQATAAALAVNLTGNITGNLSGSVGSVTGNIGGNIVGDVQGKVLGGGASVITAAGVWALDSSGNAIAPAATALSTATWTNARAAKLDNLDATISSRMAAGNVTIGGYAAGQDPFTLVMASTMTESYTTGPFTLPQALYEIAQVLGQFSISGTTLTVQKRDATTTAATFGLNDATNPTARTRSS